MASAAFPALTTTTKPARERFDLAIDATSLGMQPGDALPFSHDLVAAAELVAECVIAPEHTPLLEAARRLGCRIHTGVTMLASQLALMLDFMGATR